tara:strand:+ start:98 stop:493 length:396 start_codon:yes stop_codon:yes gene_type:complete
MADKNFTQFAEDATPDTGVWFVGTNQAETVENKFQALNLPFVAASYRAVTATDTFVASDGTIDCISGAYTVNLPTAVGVAGKTYTLKNSSTGTITLDGATTETIDGVTTYPMATQYESVSVQSNGANWILI